MNDINADDLPDVIVSRPSTKKSSRTRARKEQEIVQCNIELPANIKLSLKLQAFTEGTTVGELVTHYLTPKEAMSFFEVRQKRSA